MYEHTLPIQFIDEKNFDQPIINNASGLMAKEYEYWYTLLNIQVESQKQFLILQAQKLADALLHNLKETTIRLPEFLMFPNAGNGNRETKLLLSTEIRQQITIQERHKWFNRQTILQAIKKVFANLEASNNSGMAAFGGILRFATSYTIIHDLLPAGSSVTYSALSGEIVPSLPQNCESDTKSAGLPRENYAKRFYLPQWIAFDEFGQLLVNSIDEAETCVISMQRYLEALQEAAILAPYIVVDQVYQQKYYGILGQLVNQCRSLCSYRTNEIIATIQKRVSNNSLNRGLRITLPYFDDQSLLLRKIEFEIIPPGRVMFVPAFMVMAVQQQITMTQHNTTLNYSTRKHLLVQLASLEKAFDTNEN